MTKESEEKKPEAFIVTEEALRGKIHNIRGQKVMLDFELAEIYGIKYLPSDFKKKNGYKRSIELSSQYGLYRQNYCGCVFSKNNK